MPENVSGNFFVDKTCINCDTCRQLAPATFADQGQFSYVQKQPTDSAETRAATRALLCCPTGSIGTTESNDAKAVMQDLPLLIDGDVFYSGFNSPDSYGANSYFVRHPDGNWLIDSPKFLPHLVHKFEEMGGIKYIFLTHQDDVADAADYAIKFGAQRIIHKSELRAQPDAEIVIDGTDERRITEDFTVVPVPGHTRGHMVLLHRDKYLFTGDHLAYDDEARQLMAFRSVCWYSWSEQTDSMRKLERFDFEWVLPGHGNRVHQSVAENRAQLIDLVSRMEKL